MAKSPDAFRTISEVSEWLDTPAHVLRFWESKFTQIKPVKRAGGRRYYRPEDMALLGGIKTLLHEQGMTIKGVQKLLREQGIRHVSALGPQPLDTPFDMTQLVEEDSAEVAPPDAEAARPVAPAPPRAAHAAEAPAARNAGWSPAPAGRIARPDGPAGPVPLVPGLAEPAAPAVEPAPRREPHDAPTAKPASRGSQVLALPSEAAGKPGILSAILAQDPALLARRRGALAPVAARLAGLRDRLRAAL